jgi:hypothetical protein
MSGSSRQPDWTLIVSHDMPPAIGLELIGERLVGSEWFRYSRAPSGFRVQYSHAGIFDLSTDGARIVWYHDADALPELVRSMVLGPLIALAFELSGFLCLHGSAVTLGRRAVAFLGPKYFGKSTLATALTAAGGRLISDDLVILNSDTPVTVRPGVASIRLWADMAEALPLSDICSTRLLGVKTTVTGFAENAVELEDTVLSDVYLLAPTFSHAEHDAILRSRLAPGEAAIGLAQQTKLPDSLIGLRAAGSRLASAAAVAANVPVWRLNVPRDLSKLAAVVSQIIDWGCA